MPSVPDWMLTRAHAIAGLEFDSDGKLRDILAEVRRAVLLEPPPQPANNAWAKLARWLVLPANDRTLTPDSMFTCRQIAERERDSGFKEGIESALRYDPTVPLAHVLLAKFEENPQRADFLRGYGLKLLPDDAGLWERAVRALHEQKDEERARRALGKLEKLDKDRAAVVRETGAIGAGVFLSFLLFPLARWAAGFNNRGLLPLNTAAQVRCVDWAVRRRRSARVGATPDGAVGRLSLRTGPRRTQGAALLSPEAVFQALRGSVALLVVKLQFVEVRLQPWEANLQLPELPLQFLESRLLLPELPLQFMELRLQLRELHLQISEARPQLPVRRLQLLELHLPVSEARLAPAEFRLQLREVCLHSCENRLQRLELPLQLRRTRLQTSRARRRLLHRRHETALLGLHRSRHRAPLHLRLAEPHLGRHSGIWRSRICPAAR